MSAVQMTQAELVEEARRRFGDNARTWAFVCPHCGDVATAADFIAAGTDPNLVGQECLGRITGALHKPATNTRGCNWCAYGLFRGPWLITLPDGSTVGSFALADAS